MIELFERKETIAAVRFDGSNEQEIKSLGATVVFGTLPYGGITYDWDTFNWRPFREGDWFFKDGRGIVKVIDEVTLKLHYKGTGEKWLSYS